MIGAWVGLLLALVLFPLRFSVAQLHVHTIPIVLGGASGLYLVLNRHEHNVPDVADWRATYRTGHVINRFTFVGLAGLVFVGTYTGGRTVPFFAVAAFVGTLIFAQIFFLQRTALEPATVLVQLVALSLIVRGMALVSTPGTIGVDSWVHLPAFAESIRETGQLSAIADSHYYGTPLYHFFVAAAAEAFQSPLRIALYATLGIVMPLSILLIYFTGRFFLPARWALFATALFAVADHAVLWGIHLIPTSLGLVFFMALFYGVARIYATRELPGLYALVLLIVIATIFTHHLSTFIVLAFLGAGAMTQLYLRLFSPSTAQGTSKPGGNSVNFLLLFLVALPLTLATWNATPRDGSFLMGMVESVQVSLETAGLLALDSATGLENEVIASMATTVPLSIEVLDILGFLLLLFVTVVGTFTLLQRQHLDLLSLSWINSTAFMLFVVLGLPLFGLYFFIPGRWYAFAYVPMVILGAFGMRQLVATMSARHVVAVMVLFALLFPGAMLVNHKATPENPIADDYYHKFVYSESELVAANTIATLHPGDTAIQADDPYYIYLRDAEALPSEPLELSDDGTISATHVVYRAHQAEGGTQVVYDEQNIRTQLSADRVCRPGMDVVYTIGDVRYCRGEAR